MHNSPFMLDDETTKTNVALALKGLSALGDKAAVVDQGVIMSKRGDHSQIEQVL